MDVYHHQWDPGGSLAYCSQAVATSAHFGICPHLKGNPGPVIVGTRPVVRIEHP